MQVIAKRTLVLFWTQHPQAEQPLRTWHSSASRAHWQRPSDIKDEFGPAVDFVADHRLVFDIGGNTYRLVVHAAYAYRRALIKFAGTHAEYDLIDVETV